MKKFNKPSRAGVRILTVLCFIEGAIVVVDEEHKDPITERTIKECRKRCQQAFDAWPVVGDRELLISYTLVNIVRVQKALDDIWWLKAKPEMNYIGMCYIAMHLLEDVMLMIKKSNRYKMLQRIHDELSKLINYADPEGAAFLTQERADEVSKAVYSVIGER